MPIIEAINITSKSDQETFYVKQAYLEKNKGIVNDRYYGNTYRFNKSITVSLKQ